MEVDQTIGKKQTGGARRAGARRVGHPRTSPGGNSGGGAGVGGDGGGGDEGGRAGRGARRPRRRGRASRRGRGGRSGRVRSAGAGVTGGEAGPSNQGEWITSPDFLKRMCLNESGKEMVSHNNVRTTSTGCESSLGAAAGSMEIGTREAAMKSGVLVKAGALSSSAVSSPGALAVAAPSKVARRRESSTQQAAKSLPVPGTSQTINPGGSRATPSTSGGSGPAPRYFPQFADSRRNTPPFWEAAGRPFSERPQPRRPISITAPDRKNRIDRYMVERPEAVGSGGRAEEPASRWCRRPSVCLSPNRNANDDSPAPSASLDKRPYEQPAVMLPMDPPSNTPLKVPRRPEAAESSQRRGRSRKN